MGFFLEVPGRTYFEVVECRFFSVPVHLCTIEYLVICFVLRYIRCFHPAAASQIICAVPHSFDVESSIKCVVTLDQVSLCSFPDIVYLSPTTAFLSSFVVLAYWENPVPPCFGGGALGRCARPVLHGRLPGTSRPQEGNVEG